MNNAGCIIGSNSDDYIKACEESVIDSYDNVNEPAHYKIGGLEVKDILKAKMTVQELRGWYKGNVMKYVFRYEFKGTPLEDLEKAKVYLKELITLEQHNAR